MFDWDSRTTVALLGVLVALLALALTYWFNYRTEERTRKKIVDELKMLDSFPKSSPPRKALARIVSLRILHYYSPRTEARLSRHRTPSYVARAVNCLLVPGLWIMLVSVSTEPLPPPTHPMFLILWVVAVLQFRGERRQRKAIEKRIGEATDLLVGYLNDDPTVEKSTDEKVETGNQSPPALWL